MITVLLLAILLGVAAPGLRDTILNARLTGQANDFITDLSMARSEAVKRDIRSGVCASSNGTTCTNTAWDQGWIAFLDSDSDNAPDAAGILKVQPAFGNTNLMTLEAPNAAVRTVIYLPSGVVLGGLTLAFDICDSRNQGQRINISPTGRAVVTTKAPAAPTCP